MALVAEAAGKLLQGVDKQVCCRDTPEEEDTDKVVWLLARRHKAVEVQRAGGDDAVRNGGDVDDDNGADADARVDDGGDGEDS